MILNPAWKLPTGAVRIMSISEAAEFSSHFKTEAEMPVTMLRVNIVEGIGR